MHARQLTTRSPLRWLHGAALGALIVGASARAGDLELDGVPFDLRVPSPDPAVSPFGRLAGLTLEASFDSTGADDVTVPPFELRLDARDGDVLRPGVYLGAEWVFAIDALRRDASGSLTRLGASFARFRVDGPPVSQGRIDLTTDVDPFLGIDVPAGPPGSVRPGAFEVRQAAPPRDAELSPEPPVSPEEARERTRADPVGPSKNEPEPSSEPRTAGDAGAVHGSLPAAESPSPRRRRSFLFARVSEIAADPARLGAVESGADSVEMRAEQAFVGPQEGLAPSLELRIESRIVATKPAGLEIVTLQTPAAVDRPLRVQSPGMLPGVPARQTSHESAVSPRTSWLDAIASAVRACASWLWRHWPW